MLHLNQRLHISKNVEYKLKIASITALVIATGWYLHNYYRQCYSEHTASIQNSDTLQLETNVNNEHKTDDHSNNFQLTTEIKTDTNANEINIYSPEINVYDAVYGISKIEFDNLDINLAIEEKDFQIEINNNNNIQLIDFDINNIAIDRETNKTYIHLRLPLRLKDYSIQLRIRCKLKDIWSNFSRKIHLNVPSSLITRNFSLGEQVTFVPKGSNWGSNGTITKIVNSDCTLYLIKEKRRELNTSKDHIVHFSRIYRKGPYLYNVIDAKNKIQNRIMNKTVLVGINENDEKYDIEFMDVFDVLSGIYEKKAEEILVKMDEKHYVYIGRFVAKYVMDFLLNENRKHNLLNCMMEYSHRFMKLVPVWNNSVRNVIELNKTGFLAKVNSDNLYWCDLCGMEISKFDFIYRCNAMIINRHFFCLKCVWDIIQQHKQLTEFLKQYLRKYLYDVCIEEISSFVCGSVVYCH